MLKGFVLSASIASCFTCAAPQRPAPEAPRADEITVLPASPEPIGERGGYSVYEGLRTSCKAPPEAVIHDTEARCIYLIGQEEGPACCYSSSKFEHATGAIWQCVELTCQKDCQLPWRSVEFQCKEIEEVEPEEL